MSLRDGPFPQHGWMFFQPQTRWSIPYPLAVTFNSAVDQIISHRLKNPSITRKHNLATDWSSVADELEAFTRQRLGLAEDSPPKWLPTQPIIEQLAAVGVVEPAPGNVEGFLANTGRRLKAAATGIKVYIDTFGESGRPIDESTAEARASICATCPKNTQGGLGNFFTEKSAQGILGIYAILENLNLKTAQDQNLGVCSACLCPLKAKVHVKLTHIVRHMDEETKARLDPRCWILSESRNVTATQQNELHA